MAAEGTFPTTVIAELNRLANAGTYPSPKDFLAEAGAANAYAGTVQLETVGALNTLAGNTLPDWIGLEGVCNQLAGTTGLDASEALRRILA